MPGRVAGSSAKGASTAAKPRTSRSARATASAPASNIPDEGPTTKLRNHVATVFSDAQKSNTGHRKLVINLRKIQEACCYEPLSSKKKQAEYDFDEDDFNTEVVRCVLRVLPIKKSETVGDRIVKFLGIFLRVASEKDNQLVADQDGALPETPTSRLTNAILNTLLQLLSTKDKIVRFRATQISAHIINTLDTLDDQMFHLLRLALLKRIHDKESSVRMHAIYGLSRLAAELDEDQQDEDSDDDDASSGVLEKLLNVLQNDPSAEVRRALLLNLPLTPTTLPYLLERARDLDAATRRALYARLLPALGDFRHLSLTHREKLLRWGLRDRDETVRKATARLFRERWIEDCAALPAAIDPEEETEDGKKKPGVTKAADPSLEALLELLERIDVSNSGNTGGVALEAMSEFWDGRPDYREYVSFDSEAFWDELSPESVFVARTFNDYCRAKDAQGDGRLLDMLEMKMPEVTKFGFLLEIQINKLIECVRGAATGGPDGDGDEEMEEESVQREFIVEQMLHMAISFDYSDEVGRRKMFGLMREALTMPELPEESTRLAVETLRLVCGDDRSDKGESDFCGIVLEAIAEVHDTIMGDEGDKTKSSTGEESFHSARSEISDDGSARRSKNLKRAEADEEEEDDDEEKAIREIMVNMKCLHIAQCMLQNIQCELEQTVHLVTMLNNLVIPAVRSQEAPIRERGLVCLGLCCLLGKNLAQENITLFLHCFAKGHASLQTIAIQIITDILTTHPSLLAPVPSTADGDETSATLSATEPSPLLKPVLKTFSKSLKSEDVDVQSTGASALSKLMLSQLITDPDLLKGLVIAFFDPETNSNASLRQALTYFLPVYCHSRAANAERMATIATGVIARLAALREALIEDEDVEESEMVTLSVVGGMLVDWTDPRKVIGSSEEAKTGKLRVEEGGAPDSDMIHFVLAEQILEKLVTSQTSKDERKVLFSMLSKLHLTVSSPDPGLLRTVLELVAEAIESKVASDVTSRNSLAKMQTTLLKLMHDIATAERGGGGEETVVEDATVVQRTDVDETAQSVTGADAREEEEEEEATEVEAEDDPVNAQLRRELESTRIEDPDAEGTRMDIDEEMEDYDFSGMADDKDVQALMDSMDDDEDLIE
ncbi:ARM repeat-containing protein [Aureobasidium pullulans]|nr:ARM repeat-containing protein [Aureobasidium pullulans]THZ28369.1 ARM repeat-containing protein [Aureobasidium pullulans]